MSVAKVSEISSTSKTSFEDAIQQAAARADGEVPDRRRLGVGPHQEAVLPRRQVQAADRAGDGEADPAQVVHRRRQRPAVGAQRAQERQP